jgi:C1A family cysteine protease
MDPKTIKFGFRPEPPNPKHLSFEKLLKPRIASFASFGDKDLREFSPANQRHDQSRTSSCTANAVVRAVEIRQNMYPGGPPYVDLSRLAIYYLARQMMTPPETDKDEGSYISHACDVLRRFGVCPEADWPFAIEKLFTPPTWMSMRRAYQHKIKAFYRITSSGSARVAEVARCVQAGLPVVYGTLIGSDWYGYRGELASIPPLDVPAEPKGGHATILIGTMGNTFIGENSWGSGWGDEGFYRITTDVIASRNSSDFWVMENTDDPWA